MNRQSTRKSVRKSRRKSVRKSVRKSRGTARKSVNRFKSPAKPAPGLKRGFLLGKEGHIECPKLRKAQFGMSSNGDTTGASSHSSRRGGGAAAIATPAVSIPVPLSASYKKEKALGSGAFGQIFEYTNTATGEKFAAKIMKKSDHKTTEMARNEVKILTKLQHKGVLELVEAFETDNEVHLVTELCETTLLDILKNDRRR